MAAWIAEVLSVPNKIAPFAPLTLLIAVAARVTVELFVYELMVVFRGQTPSKR